MLLAPSKLRVAARIKLSTPSEMVIRILRQKVTTCDNHEDMTEMTILYIYISKTNAIPMRSTHGQAACQAIHRSPEQNRSRPRFSFHQW